MRTLALASRSPASGLVTSRASPPPRQAPAARGPQPIVSRQVAWSGGTPLIQRKCACGGEMDDEKKTS